ncbi:MAG: TolC family protein [Deltaproteobacteria bacterium]|jgi:outer membrane protein|nr:TolC family protein [Deltaproteobacteria bacterium]
MRRETFSFCRRPAALLCLGLAVLLAAAGCAEPIRQTIDRPFIAEPVSPETVFGEATLGPEADGKVKPVSAPADEGPLTLEQSLAMARLVSPSLDTADQGYAGAMWSRWQAITAFLPTASTTYQVVHSDDFRPVDLRHDQWTWQNRVSQPIFSGGRNVANYLLSQLGLAAADIKRAQAREDLLLAVKEAFYGILASEKALKVAKTTVVNLTSHLNVARNFYEVGMAPQNQVLQAEVELAKAQQEEINQSRNLVVNQARLNILLRRPVDHPVKLRDELKHDPFPLTMERCQEVSLRDNPEIRLGLNAVESGAKSVDVARANLYPEVVVSWSNTSTGADASAHGGPTSSSSWNMAAVASFNFWEWGRSKAGVEISKVQLNQAINALTSLEDATKLELTSNYQTLVSAGRNISVAAKAVESAAEDLRMVSERYQEQVATNTEVLDAQTRYSEAQYEYYQSLYNYNLSWAAIERTMGRRVTPAGLAPEERAPARP